MLAVQFDSEKADPQRPNDHLNKIPASATPTSFNNFLTSSTKSYFDYLQLHQPQSISTTFRLPQPKGPSTTPNFPNKLQASPTPNNSSTTGPLKQSASNPDARAHLQPTHQPTNFGITTRMPSTSNFSAATLKNTDLIDLQSPPTSRPVSPAPAEMDFTEEEAAFSQWNQLTQALSPELVTYIESILISSGLATEAAKQAENELNQTRQELLDTQTQLELAEEHSRANLVYRQRFHELSSIYQSLEGLWDGSRQGAQQQQAMIDDQQETIRKITSRCQTLEDFWNGTRQTALQQQVMIDAQQETIRKLRLEIMYRDAGGENPEPHHREPNRLEIELQVVQQANYILKNKEAHMTKKILELEDELEKSKEEIVDLKDNESTLMDELEKTKVEVAELEENERTLKNELQILKEFANGKVDSFLRWCGLRNIDVL
ncbi:hypothetical protein G7Y89_g12713 [Cudoniella acicularis]|uniref:Uncharacterized protein n=1 Tax=Cudoniella acicularis TaxID=354080 RepID=A0A8H4VYW8_9HELO|nr:hypothetical protein G7Y89_g12713 [Cudoniella acicularis]